MPYMVVRCISLHLTRIVSRCELQFWLDVWLKVALYKITVLFLAGYLVLKIPYEAIHSGQQMPAGDQAKVLPPGIAVELTGKTLGGGRSWDVCSTSFSFQEGKTRIGRLLADLFLPN